jgi:hypothetical protein
MWADACVNSDETAWLNAAEASHHSDEDEAAIASLIRESIANPFRPVSPDPSLLTPSVVSLAHGAYDERSLPAGTLDPHRLAVLADALEDAGCNNAAILDHLRGPGPHVRGCWPVDLLLGKTE